MTPGLWNYGRFALVFAILSAFSGIVTAQDGVSARFVAQNLAPLVGQPVELVLIVQVPAGAIVNWPDFPEEWSPFLVRAVGEKEIVSGGSGQTIRQILTVVLWQPGDHETPDLTLDYQLAGQTETRQIITEKAFFSVSSVLDLEDLTLRPLKPPVSLPYVSPLLVLVTAAGLVSAVFAGRRWRHRPTAGLRRVVAPSDLHPAAQAALNRIRRAADNPQAEESYRVAADALRGYVGQRFGLPAPEWTTGELVAAMETHPELALRRLRELGHMLEQADLVKFAAMQPRTKAAQRLLGAAYQWIEQVDRAAGIAEKQP